MTTSISTRWTPATVERRNTLDGSYEILNPRDLGLDEATLQRALLTPINTQRRVSFSTWAYGATLAAVAAVLSVQYL